MSRLLHACWIGTQGGLEVSVGSWSSDFFFLTSTHRKKYSLHHGQVTFLYLNKIIILPLLCVRHSSILCSILFFYSDAIHILYMLLAIQ